MSALCLARHGFLAACLATVALLGATVCAAPGAVADPKAPPKFAEKLATPDTLAALRAGGFSLYLRHGPTDNSHPDRFPSVDLNDCRTQRPLTEEGRQLAAEVGQAIRAARIPLADIHISPMCRVKDTAAAAFPGQAVLLDAHLMYTANLTRAQKAPILARTRVLLSELVRPGSNRLVIAHGPNLMDLMAYFPKEATLVVFKPQGNGQVDYVASIPAAAWTNLLPAGALK